MIMKNEAKFEKIDLIIIIICSLAIIIASVLTAVLVNYKAEKKNKEVYSSYTAIPRNSKYRYKISNNEISFYDGKSIVDTYKCTKNCSIKDYATDQFKSDYDEFIPIYDNDQYIIYNIDIKSVYYTFDSYPKITNNKDYGLVMSNGKYGLVSSKGSLILKAEFDSVELTENYLITLKNNVLNIYDKYANKLTNDEINNIYEVAPVEKENSLYLYITDTNLNRKILNYDKKTNSFII